MTVVSAAHVVALSNSGASAAEGATAGHDRRGLVVEAPAPLFVRRCWLFRIVGLVSDGLLKSPDWIAALGGVASAPLGG